ncbi:hypothetical protein ACTPOK_20125 [Streptomyces inhibens]|uniref:hypothetical protein n=1 Tax=Streptomyces inhibens TaxID=2293571 RepID=UPI00402AE517
MTDDVSRDVPTATSHPDSASMRLLPWTTTDGNPCFLISDGDGLLSQLADDFEAELTSSATNVLAGARAVLADQQADSRLLRFALERAAESLDDVLRVNKSLGTRFPETDCGASAGEDDGPKLPAESFG